MAQHMSVIEARKDFSKTVNRVAFGGERVVFERHGEPVAVLISVEDAAWLEEMEDKMDIEAADAVMDRNECGTLTMEEMKAKYGVR